MESFYVKRIREVKKNKKELEDSLNVRIEFSERQTQISGKSIDEYEAERVFQAIDFGFSVKRALLLKQEDYVFRIVHIRDHTKRNLKDVKARLIGTKGKTKRTFSQLSECEVFIGETEVGVIGRSEDVEDTIVAIINVIKGSKQANMYKFLEKRNKQKKDDLSLNELKLK